MHMPALLQTSLPVVQQLPLPQGNLPLPPAAEQAHFSVVAATGMVLGAAYESNPYRLLGRLACVDTQSPQTRNETRGHAADARVAVDRVSHANTLLIGSHRRSSMQPCRMNNVGGEAGGAGGMRAHSPRRPTSSACTSPS